jgi:F420-non-reducing hydrogenase large subunit
MTQTINIDPVRWQDIPARVAILSNNGTARVYYQVTTPLNISGMCEGRPVEELPRILTILSPAHHLVSAKALDRLFDVTPPSLAENAREALLQTQFISGHFRKLYFLLTAIESPFKDSHSSRRGTSQVTVSHIAENIMRHLALAQEAAIILGGRNDHPLTSLPGGISCYLKNNSYERLEEIAGILVQFVGDLADFFRKNFWTSPKALKDFSEIRLKPMAGISIVTRNSNDSEKPQEDELVVTDINGKEATRISVEKTLDSIELVTESWSYMPFSFFRDKGWQGIQSETDSLFFTGPLARLNSKKAMDTEKAEEERCNMVASIGPFPHFSVRAAFWALIVEAFQSAEKMTRLCVREKLTGPFTRQIPKTIGTETFAALESPQGVIYHYYQVDSKGLLKNIRILDTSMENNALRCLMAQKAYEVSTADKDSWEKTKNRIEVSLLPF